MSRNTLKQPKSNYQDYDRMRGDLLTLAVRINHDLRTPLGGIISTAEAIREVLAECEPSALPLAESLLNSAEEISQLVKQVSFLNRASTNPLPKNPVPMAEPVFLAQQRLESRLRKHPLVIREPTDWPVVPGVSIWLDHIWWHLIANAMEHAGSPSHVDLAWNRSGDLFRFSVTDDGRGVPEHIRGKLFKEFHELHEARDVPGLGLSVVQRLVALQGGSCGHEAPPGGGACFYFTLPA